MTDHPRQSAEIPSLPSALEVATALVRAQRGLGVDDPRVARYVKLVESGRGTSRSPSTPPR